MYVVYINVININQMSKIIHGLFREVAMLLNGTV